MLQLSAVSRLRRYAEHLFVRRFQRAARIRQSAACSIVPRLTFARSSTKDLDSRWRPPEPRVPARPQLQPALLSFPGLPLAPMPWPLLAKSYFLTATVKPREPRRSTMLLSRLLVSVWLSMISPWFSQNAPESGSDCETTECGIARSDPTGLEAGYGQRDQPMRKSIGSGFSRSAEREGSEADL